MDIILASGNAHKLEEIQAMLKDLPLKVRSAKALGGMPEVEENAPDLCGNARLKALALKVLAPDSWILADDSGLFVEALEGAPGVHSARYAGENASDLENNTKLIAALADTPLNKRSAYFACVFCLLTDSEELFFEGRCVGNILTVPQGDQGFGYDPLFVPEGYTQSLAELGPEIKNQISHRSQAVNALREWALNNLS